MKERPILFSAPMVLALLNGSKTQTRRICKPAMVEGLSHVIPVYKSAAGEQCPPGVTPGWFGDEEGDVQFSCPYGQPGDRLYVRETWAQPAALDPGPTVYRADYPACVPPGFTNLPAADEITWKPSIHMPRVLSRIMLEVVSVRVERLQDISEPDARAEGITDGGCVNCGDPEPCGCTNASPDARDAYCNLWGQINGPSSWDSNPWVWVLEFKRVTS